MRRHHLIEADAQAILASAVRVRQGIVISEATSRSLVSLGMMLGISIALWIFTPFICPFRWSRLFWTYVAPVVLFAVTFDGIVSCLRIYTQDEMKSMARTVCAEGYDWETGTSQESGQRG